MSGIVLRQNLPGFTVVDQYYAMSKREPMRNGTLTIDRVDSFANTFKSLAEMRLAKKRSHVVIVAHGTPELGLTMDIATGSHVSAGTCILALGRLVDQLDETKGRSVKSDFLSSPANEWGVSDATALSLAKTCREIRWAKGICVVVHIRGCDIGKQVLVGENHVRLLQRLFRSAVVSAPDCAMFYVRVNPGIAPQGVKKLRRQPFEGGAPLDLRGARPELSAPGSPLPGNQDRAAQRDREEGGHQGVGQIHAPDDEHDGGELLRRGRSLAARYRHVLPGSRARLYRSPQTAKGG